MSFTYERRYRGPLRAVILDWAGTTVDFGSRAPAGVFAAVFARRGVEITLAQAREPMGLPKRDHIETILAMEPVARRWKEVHGRPATGADVDELYREFIPVQLECLPDFGDLIPGVKEAIGRFRDRGLKIGATTGYNREMMQVVRREAKNRGFEPDASICASDVPAGRPAPWMALKAAMELGVFPMEAIVKVGDTLPDIDEGTNAGMWSVGVAKTGNELGLSETELARADPGTVERKLAAIRTRMFQQGAHYVVDAVGDLDPVLDDIEQRLRRGDRP